MEFKRKDIIQRKEGMISSNIDGEAVMMSVENGKYYGLNELGTAIWELTENDISFEEIINKLMEDYEVEHKDCLRDVSEFLNDIHTKGLINIV